MDDEAFKKTKRFINGSQINSLAGRLPLCGLAAIKSPLVEVKVPKVGCKVFLVGGSGASPSVWHRTHVDQLETGSPPVEELESILEDYVGRIMTPEERRQSGLKAAPKLTVTDVVADDSRKLVFLSFKANEMDIDEHGLVAVRENAKWRLDDAGFISNYIQDSTLPEDSGGSEPVSLVGRWVLDEAATVELLRKQGDSESFVRTMLKNLRGAEWIVTDTHLTNRHPTNYNYVLKLVSIEIKNGRCQIAVEIPGLKEPEVWKLKIKDDRIFGSGCVMKRESAS
jgi:hypothetical protein